MSVERKPVAGVTAAVRLRAAASDVTRVEILRAAERMLTHFERTTVASIAAEAGLSPSSLYQYFKSKEAILHTLFEVRGRELLLGLERATLAIESAQLLHAFTSAHLAYYDLHPDLLALMLAGESPQVPHGVVRDAVLVIRQDYIALVGRIVALGRVAGLFRESLPLRDQTVFVMSVVNGFAVFQRTRTSPLQRHAAVVVELLMSGLGRHPELPHVQ